MESSQLIIGSHVSMRGKDMMEGSVREALSYGANTFMLYTGAPQNTRRKPVEELRIPQAQRLMEENGMEDFVVHAPYLINLANTVKPELMEHRFGFSSMKWSGRDGWAANFSSCTRVPMWAPAQRRGSKA